MSISRKRKRQPKRAAKEIVADLVSETYDQLAADMVVALYRKKQDIIRTINGRK
jgi:hypothetical protein